MSRSIHQTLKQVFYKKPKKEINEMCNVNNPDIDVIELQKKSRIKNDTLMKRKSNKLLEKQNKSIEE